MGKTREADPFLDWRALREQPSKDGRKEKAVDGLEPGREQDLNGFRGSVEKVFSSLPEYRRKRRRMSEGNERFLWEQELPPPSFQRKGSQFVGWKQNGRRSSIGWSVWTKRRRKN
jgi:hypothetical protein